MTLVYFKYSKVELLTWAQLLNNRFLNIHQLKDSQVELVTLSSPAQYSICPEIIHQLNSSQQVNSSEVELVTQSSPAQ